MITISVCTDEERQAVAQAVENGSLAAALGVRFKVERVSVGPGGGAGISWPATGTGGTGAVVPQGCGPGGSSGAFGSSSIGNGGGSGR